jgi:hypothetical protein
MVSRDYIFAVLLVGVLYLMVHMIHWTGGHSWRH